MNVVTWVLVALLAGLVAGFVRKRGSYGRGWDMILGLLGGVAVSWFFKSHWAGPEPGQVAVMIVPRLGAGRLCRPAHDLSGPCVGPWPDELAHAAPESTETSNVGRSQRMDANRGKLSVGQRWSDARPTKTVTFWCCVASAVLTMIIGFGWGGWVTGGTAGRRRRPWPMTRSSSVWPRSVSCNRGGIPRRPRSSWP